MKQLTYLVLALFVMLNMSCEKDKAIDLNAMLTQGKWRMTTYTTSPGVRLGTTINSPIITDVFTIYSSDFQEDVTYQFFSNGTVKVHYSRGAWEDEYEGTWNVSSDQKNLVLFGESTEIHSVKDGEFVLSETELMYDSYLKEDVLQKTMMTYKKF